MVTDCDFRGTGAKPTDLGHTNTSGFLTIADRRFTDVFIMRDLAGLMDAMLGLLQEGFAGTIQKR
jgi:hypothetical protein